jgi:hypothetical protein
MKYVNGLARIGIVKVHSGCKTSYSKLQKAIFYRYGFLLGDVVMSREEDTGYLVAEGTVYIRRENTLPFMARDKMEMWLSGMEGVEFTRKED